MTHSVLLDTSFIIRLLNDDDPLHNNALGYFKYFLEKDVSLYFSTISIAEYCVRGSISDLPLKNIRVLPFNIDHARRTGDFARILFEKKKGGEIIKTPRTIIPNDSKLFAQADIENSINDFLTSDARSMKIWNILNLSFEINFVLLILITLLMKFMEFCLSRMNNKLLSFF